jgi:hypothetical protein
VHRTIPAGARGGTMRGVPEEQICTATGQSALAAIPRLKNLFAS